MPRILLRKKEDGDNYYIIDPSSCMAVNSHLSQSHCSARLKRQLLLLEIVHCNKLRLSLDDCVSAACLEWKGR